MSIGCVILNYNDYNETIHCINNILKIDNNNELYLIIVDNNSSNNSYNILKDNYYMYRNVMVLESGQNGGYAKGNNYGLRFIDKFMPDIQFTIIMNPDTRLKSIECVKKMQETLEQNEQLAIVAPVVILNGVVDYPGTAWNTPDRGDLLRNHCKLTKYKSKQYINKNSHGIVRVDAVQGALFMIRMTALKSIGFLDEQTFMYSEEVLLSRDLAKKGYGEAVLADYYFFHNHKNSHKKITLSGRIKSEDNFLNSRQEYCRKHLDKLTLFELQIVHCINILYIILTNPVLTFYENHKKYVSD